MKRKIAFALCLVLILSLLAACQKEPEVPFITNPAMQNNQQVTTQPTQGNNQQPATQPTQGNNQQPATQPTTQPADPTEFDLPTPEECTYEQYMAMTGDQQEQFFNQFNGDFAAFFAWLDKAKAESDANNSDIVIDPDSTIDLDSILGQQ